MIEALHDKMNRILAQQEKILRSMKENGSDPF